MTSITDVKQADLDEAARTYDPRSNGYRLEGDPRCLWGWGPGSRNGCRCMFGHACFRAFGHPGKCWDAGGPLDPPECRKHCDTAQRPKTWDSRGRAEANR